MRMPVLLKQVEDRVRALLELQVAFGAGQRNYPQKVHRIAAQNELLGNVLSRLTTEGNSRIVSKTELPQNGAGGFPLGTVCPDPIHVFWS
jgi:hypothetical protein